MRFRIPTWATLAVVEVLLVFTLVGCGKRGVRPPDTSRGPQAGFHDGPAGVLLWVSLGASALAGVGLILCALLAAVLPNKIAVAKAAIACVCILVGSQIAYQLAQHLVLATCLVVVVLAASAGLWAWVNRKAIEKKVKIDLNRDGKIG